MTPIDTVHAELTIDRARAAARSGDLDQALALLRDLDDAGAATPRSLDLLARVHAQRGEYTEAGACWTRVGDTGDPADAADARLRAGAEEGRRLAAEIAAGRRPRLARARPGRVTLAAVPVAVLLVAGGLALPGAAGTGTPARPGTAQAQVQRQRADALQRRLRTVRDDRARERHRRSHALDAARRRIAMPGVTVRRADGALRVVFTSGLFVQGVELTPRGARLLDRLGRRLRADRVMGAVSTTIVGHAVAVPNGRTRGGSTVALARAQIAAQRLATASRHPLTAFRLATADQRDGPYRDPRRNRTVTLTLAPAPPS